MIAPAPSSAPPEEGEHVTMPPAGDQYEQLWPTGNPGEAPAPPRGTLTPAAAKSTKKMSSARERPSPAPYPPPAPPPPATLPPAPTSPLTLGKDSTSKPTSVGSDLEDSGAGNDTETGDGGGKKKKKKKSTKSTIKKSSRIEESNTEVNSDTVGGGGQSFKSKKKRHKERQESSRFEEPSNDRTPKCAVPCFVFFVLLTFAGIASAGILAAHQWFGLAMIDVFTLKDVN